MYNFRSRNPYATPASSTSHPTSANTGAASFGYDDDRSRRGSIASDISSTTTLINNDFNFSSPSSSSLPRATSASTYNADAETTTLIAELLYEDLQEILSQRKGKSRQGGPLSDAEYALQLQSEQLEGMLIQTQDAEIAGRMQDAMRSDQELIAQMVLNEEVARQDHEAALALERGQPLPNKTKEQLAVERGVKSDMAL